MPLPKGYTVDPAPKLPPGYQLDSSPDGAAAEVTPPAKLRTISEMEQFRKDHPILGGAADLGIGAARGVASTLGNIDAMANKIPGVGEFLSPSDKVAKMQAHGVPQNTMQKIGKGAEQTAEFLVPGGAEESLLGKSAGLLARMAVKGAAAGAVNRAQGGTFTGGALAGGAGEAIGSGLKQLAPSMAEIALKVRGTDRGFGAEPGEAILKNTTGIKPSTVVASGKQSLQRLGGEKSNLLSKAPDVDLTPARSTADSFVSKAQVQGHRPTLQQVEDVSSQLHSDLASGGFLPQNVPALRAAEIQRGVSQAATFNPTQTADLTEKATRGIYGKLGESIEGVAPGVAPINKDIQSLIPVVARGKAADLNAGILERLAHKGVVHTGALAGAAAGYATHGLPGALAAFAVPELANSPETWLAAARIANSPALKKLAIPTAQGMASQFFRPEVTR